MQAHSYIVYDLFKTEWNSFIWNTSPAAVVASSLTWIYILIWCNNWIFTINKKEEEKAITMCNILYKYDGSSL